MSRDLFKWIRFPNGAFTRALNSVAGRVAGIVTALYDANTSYFDGVDQYWSIPDSASLSPTTGISFGGWFFADLGGLDAYGRMISKVGSIGDRSFSSYWTASTDKCDFFFYSDGTAIEGLLTTPAITRNVWTAFMYTFDGTTARLYVNGVETSNTAVTASVYDSTAPIEIGRTPTAFSGEDFKGGSALCEVVNRALTPTEVLTRHGSGAKGWNALPTADKVGSVGFWPLANWTGQAAGDEGLDQSGNSNTASNENEILFYDHSLEVEA